MSDEEKSNNYTKPSSEFTALNFLWRVLFSLVLVLATYNPTGFSYYDWASDAIASNEFGAVQFFVGMVLLAGWVILWVATWRALETLGLALAAVIIGALVWLLIDLGLLDPDSATAIRWIAVISAAVLLGIGLSWSHVWRRLTGQLEVDQD